jgi:uncharacterized protein YbjT (DUF2867 family)
LARFRCERTYFLHPRLIGMTSSTTASQQVYPDSVDGKPTVFVIGATGLIGSAIVARLSAEGFDVIALVRKPEGPRPHASRTIVLDLKDAQSPADWVPRLQGVDAVINCAGVLQSGGRDSTRVVHERAPLALFEACEQIGLKKLVHFSALGVDRRALSAFSLSKQTAEAALQRSSLDWVILRPSVVLGEAAYGGSALFRGLASLPWLPRFRDAGLLSVVQMSDLVETVVMSLRDDFPARIAIDLVGPESLPFERVVGLYRHWLGWPAARLVDLPRPLMALGFWAGDIAGRLGWRPPIRSNAQLEMRRGAAGESGPWTAATRIVPKSLEEALAQRPASVQERWFARLFLLKPVAFLVFASFWFLTGFVSLGPGYDIGLALMREGGAGPLSGPTVIAGGLADLVIGAGILWRPTTGKALWGALALTAFYVIVGTLILPRLWEEPLGPMMKVWPIVALNFVLLAILEER